MDNVGRKWYSPAQSVRSHNQNLWWLTLRRITRPTVRLKHRGGMKRMESLMSMQLPSYSSLPARTMQQRAFILRFHTQELPWFNGDNWWKWNKGVSNWTKTWQRAREVRVHTELKLFSKNFTGYRHNTLNAAKTIKRNVHFVSLFQMPPHCHSIIFFKEIRSILAAFLNFILFFLTTHHNPDLNICMATDLTQDWKSINTAIQCTVKKTQLSIETNHCITPQIWFICLFVPRGTNLSNISTYRYNSDIHKHTRIQCLA